MASALLPKYFPKPPGQQLLLVDRAVLLCAD